MRKLLLTFSICFLLGELAFLAYFLAPLHCLRELDSKLCDLLIWIPFGLDIVYGPAAFCALVGTICVLEDSALSISHRPMLSATAIFVTLSLTISIYDFGCVLLGGNPLSWGFGEQPEYPIIHSLMFGVVPATYYAPAVVFTKWLVHRLETHIAEDWKGI